jgi:two-component system response regulator YesN
MSVSEITKDIPYTKQHICNTFKKYIGQSITEYFLHQRLNYAKYLLLSTTDSIASIANITGFNNTSFFYRSFKKQFDVTPSELRKTK